ncbi:damage-inducible protein DinB [Priestia aryabhattai]|uniref:DinB family protein n=1 Tax=Priestia aryabhattai TaxID=412384 RepID=UPI000BF267CB|nr:DinB family protein [Priestia aryabhattai]PFW71995.1 damage-inducible protein DinB [Priestia aryabhattai]
MSHHLLKLCDYHAWANQKIFDRLKELSEDIYDKEIQSVFSSISKVMAHIYVSDNIWLDCISGKKFDEAFASANQLREEIETKRIEDVETMFFDLSGRYKAFLNRQEDIETAFVLETSFAGRLETRLSDVVQHVVNHGTYHRGNITAMLRQLGHPGVMTDYILYLYERDTKE